LEDDGVVDVEPATAILRGRGRVEPALRAELMAECAQREVALVVVLGGYRRPLVVRRHVRLEPGSHLAAEPLLLLGVRDLEIHVRSLSSVVPIALCGGCASSGGADVALAAAPVPATRFQSRSDEPARARMPGRFAVRADSALDCPDGHVRSGAV